MKKSLTVNYLYNIVYKILTLITPLITTPYVSRVLGVENIGIYNYTYAILSYFVLFGVLGLQMYGQREIAYKNNNIEERNKVFWNIFWTRLITVGIALIVYFIFLFNTDYKLIYLLFSLELVSNAIDISWLYYGSEDFKTITIKNIIIKILGVLGIFFLVKNENHLQIYVFCHTSVLLVGNISLWFEIRKKITKVYGISKDCFHHLKLALVFFLPQCLDSVYMLMDKVMLGNLANMQEVGIYGQADKIIKMVVTVITSLGLVVSPRIAECYANSDKQGIKKYMKKSFDFVFIFSFPIIFGLIGVAKPFCNIFFGNEYDGVVNIMKAMTPIILFMGLNSIIGWQYLMTVNKEKQFTFSVFCGALVNLIMNYFMIKILYALGAVIASITSMGIMTIINYHYIRDIVKIKKLVKSAFKPLIASLIMYVCILPISTIIEIDLLNVIAKVVVGIIVYFAVLLIIKEEYVIEYKNKFLKKLKKRLKN